LLSVWVIKFVYARMNVAGVVLKTGY